MNMTATVTPPVALLRPVSRKAPTGFARSQIPLPGGGTLTTEEFDQAWNQGRAMTLDDAVRYALDEEAGSETRERGGAAR
jgi:hypothetical protein